MSFKQNTYHLIDGRKGNHKLDGLFDLLVSALIVLNVLFIFLESYAGVRAVYGDFFHAFELFSIGVFSLEYLLRLWTADLQYPRLPAGKARLKFMFSFMGMIDLLAIAPFFLPLLVTLDLRIVRALRLLRLLRMFKLGRHSKSLRMIGDVLKETKFDLLVTFFLTVILLIIASTLMFFLERDAQPEAFENIGQSLWWAVATLTTVGYGDIYPITGMGKFLSGIIALIGIGIVALPTGIISSAFVEKLSDHKVQRTITDCNCPHCGQDIRKKPKA